MATERSDRVYEWYFDATQKFDYFVTGISLAMVGYLGSTFTASPLGWNPSTIELASIASLLGSAIAGLKRAESSILMLAGTQKKLREHESAGAMAGIVSSGQAGLNTETGEFVTPEQAAKRLDRHKAGATIVAGHLDTAAKWAVRWYHARNFLLVLGLALLLLARIAVAYVGAT